MSKIQQGAAEGWPGDGRCVYHLEINAVLHLTGLKWKNHMVISRERKHICNRDPSPISKTLRKQQVESPSELQHEGTQSRSPEVCVWASLSPLLRVKGDHQSSTIPEIRWGKKLCLSCLSCFSESSRCGCRSGGCSSLRVLAARCHCT